MVVTILVVNKSEESQNGARESNKAFECGACWVSRPRTGHVTSTGDSYVANAAKTMQVIQSGKPELSCSDLFGRKRGGSSSSCGDARW